MFPYNIENGTLVEILIKPVYLLHIWEIVASGVELIDIYLWQSDVINVFIQALLGSYFPPIWIMVVELVTPEYIVFILLVSVFKLYVKY